MLKLVAHRLKVSEDSLYDEFKKVKSPGAAKRTYATERAASPSEKPLILGHNKKNRTLLSAEEELLCLALLNADLRARVVQVLQDSGLTL